MTKHRVTEWNPDWRTKAIAAATGGAMALLSFGSPQGYSWWGSITSAGAALIVPMLAFREFWNQSRFWITFGLLVAVQVPLVIAVRPFVEQFRFVFMLGFGAVDCIFVIAVIYGVCSAHR